MEVILLERVAKLGQMGDVVRVKDGFARNFLLPKGKALRATRENRSRFEGMKVELEARNLEQRSEAEKVGHKLDGRSFTVLRQAAEGGQLYGSVSPRDLAALVVENGFTVDDQRIPTRFGGWVHEGHRRVHTDVRGGAPAGFADGQIGAVPHRRHRDRVRSEVGAGGQ